MTETVHVEEHKSFIKTSNQLFVAMFLAFAVPIAVIVLLAQYVTSGLDVDPTNPLMSEDAVYKRIKPVGDVVLAEAGAAAAAAPAPVATAAAAPAAAAPAKVDGKATYEQACVACHGAGIAGAPKAGDKAAWAPRIAQGKATLHDHAIKGIRMMPAKGGNASLADDAVKAAVDHMVGMSK
jgi:cytochrome c5